MTVTPGEKPFDKVPEKGYHKSVTGRVALTLVIGLLLASCTSQATSPAPTPPAFQTTLAPEPISPTPTRDFPTGTPYRTPTETTANYHCADEEVNRIGESIAASYSFTTSQEVMTWFCEGAEFEDILLALDTEELTSTAAEDLLLMRADGLSWEEIWQVVGITE